jgi:hypothetical protein
LTQRNIVAALLLTAVAIAAILLVRTQAGNVQIDAANAKADAAVDMPGLQPRSGDLPKLKGVPAATPADPSAAGLDIVPVPTPSVPTALPVPPTPPDIDDAVLALADPKLPVEFPMARYWVDRFLATQAQDPQAGLRLDRLFPPSILGRFEVPPETQVVSINEHPAMRPGALDEAFRPGPDKTWGVALRLRTPNGEQVDRLLELRH